MTNPDFIDIKAAVLTAMANGITMSPPGMVVTFRQMVRRGLASAQHLGTITSDEVDALGLLGFGMPRMEARLWPTRDVSYVLSGAFYVNLVWLQVLSPTASQVHVFGRTRSSSEWTMLLPFILASGGILRPKQAVGIAELQDMHGAFNATVCAMDGLSLLLTRPFANAA